MKRRSRTGKIYFHYCVATKAGRKYLPRARLPTVEAQIELEKRARAMLSAIKDALKIGDSGRPPILDTEIRATLAAAGYTVHGNKIRRNRKTYFTPEALDYRYSMLDDDLKSIVGSPQNLAVVERKSIARLLSYSGKKSSGKTFDTCFSEIIHEICQKHTP